MVEIGVGSGEAALHFALANPEWHVLGIEVHRSSLARFVLSLEEVCLEQMSGPPAQLLNMTIADRDAVEVLALLPTASVSEVRVFFPDPWPKRSQRHRRLIQQPFLVSVARVLRLGGLLRLATDDDEYARQMNAEVLDAGAFRVHSADRPDRPVTYYESQALAAGRTVRDLCAVRT